MNAQLTEIMRLITNLIRTGVVTEVDRENWLCRVKTGDLETNWISWLTLRAGNARTWWRPSEGEQVVLLSLGGNLETAFALPAVYSNQFPPPSDSEDGNVVEYPDGGWFEYEPATGRWYVRGIKSMVIEAADNITLKTSEFVLEADRTRINSEVVINGGVTQGGGITVCLCPFPYQQEQRMAVIDLSQLPAPQIVDVPDFETLLAERKAEFVALHPKDEQEAVIRTLELESEPATKLLQENAYRELLLRQRINEAAQAVMVAYAMGGDLDQLAANYNVTRLTVTPADNDAVPPVAAVMESDEALRLRVPAAFEGLSVAGPTAAYEFHALSADGRVADASATSPAPAEVVLTVLSREGDGTAEKDLLDVVEKALNSENVRPVADRLTVRSAEIIPYRVEATIFLYPGPEAEPVMAAAKASLQKYIASQTRLGRDIRRSAIFAALHVEGVQRVELASPLADVVLNKTQAASCTQWSVTNGGTDE